MVPTRQDWQASRYRWPAKEVLTVLEVIRKARRGFASMSPEKQREIASKGGRAAHAKGTAHEWSADEAREAGRKGGQMSRGGRGKLPTGV
ncbi:MAG TPA: KGG domain-containing protein [Vicinamibacterales bacterium]|nr:KGG domain-containing protein [Vicinamibacterales bacterium]